MSTETHTDPRTGFVPADSLANRLILVRKELGLTQRDAAEQAGVGYGAWQSWEAGSSPHNEVRVLTRVADALGVDREWLMFGGGLSHEQHGPDGGPGRPASLTAKRARGYSKPQPSDPKDIPLRAMYRRAA